MKARSILFSTDMVKALLDGRKTQTRRVVNPQPELPGFWKTKKEGGYHWANEEHFRKGGIYHCPHGQSGDYLYVRETWKPDDDDDICGIRYKDDSFIPIENTAAAADKWISVRKSEEQWPDLKEPLWRPSIHMPRWASRLTLKITDIRVERVQDIGESDAYSEGAITEIRPDKFIGSAALGVDGKIYVSWLSAWVALWDSINDKRGYGWNVNPWVWVISFEVIHKNIDEVLNESQN